MLTLTVFILAIPIILIVALFNRKGFTVTRGVNIHRPAPVIFSYLRLLKNQDNYHRQLMIDPTMKKQFTGTDGDAGCLYAWESKNPKVGSASQKIIEIVAPEKVAIEIVFEKPFSSKAQLIMELTPVNDKETTVTWTFNGNQHPYYLLRVGHLLFMVKKAVTKNLEQSLHNLQTLLNK